MQGMVISFLMRKLEVWTILLLSSWGYWLCKLLLLLGNIDFAPKMHWNTSKQHLNQNNSEATYSKIENLLPILFPIPYYVHVKYKSLSEGLQFQLQHIKSLEVITTARSTRKSWINWKSVTFLRPIRGLGVTGKIATVISGETGESKIHRQDMLIWSRITRVTNY